MSYLALARKWRPKVFKDVIGQDHVVAALSNALNNQKVHHAFLFTGTRGVGKTTLARIFAKALNCETGVSADPCGQCIACRSIDQGNFVDLIEVDAASRTKVDDTRELLDNVQYTPTQGRYKIYLIDEVHMLSAHSFNALLKTLEEPPEHVKFLLATTDPQKLPTTILSRCIQFNLKSVNLEKLSTQLVTILEAEGIHYELAAVALISRSANGSVRDALSLLDQGIAFCDGDLTLEKIRSMLGMIDDHLVVQLLEHTVRIDTKSAMKAISDMVERSAEFSSVLDDLLALIHNIALYQVSPESLQDKGVGSESIESLAGNVDAEVLQLLYQIAISGKKDFDFAADPRSGFEMIVIRMMAFQPEKMNTGLTSNPGQGGKPGTVDASESREPGAVVARPGQTSVQNNVASIEKARDADPGKPMESNQEETVEAPVPDHKPDTPNISVEDLASPENWRYFIDASGLNGIAREILMNMVPRKVTGKTVTVSLASASRPLFSIDRKRKIEQHCRDRMSLDIEFNVEIEDLSQASPGNETPTQSLEREQQEREEAARKNFTEDETVQELVNIFDAEIVDNSIKPANPK